MGTILIILAIFAVGGAILAKSGGDSASAGALAGASAGGSCMLQLMLMALPVLAGLWLLSLIF